MKKHILIGSIIILTSIILLFITKKTETFDMCADPTCSSVENGIEYRHYKCTDGTNVVDNTLCTVSKSDLEKQCSRTPCAVAITTFDDWVPRMPTCAPVGVTIESVAQTRTWSCKDANGNNLNLSECQAPSVDLLQRYSPIPDRRCAIFKQNQNWYGNQFYHYSLPTTSITDTTLFGDVPRARNLTPNTELTFDNNTISLPSGLRGNFVLFMFFPSSTGVKTMNITIASSTNITPFKFFELSNTSKTTPFESSNKNFSTTLLYYTFAFRINDVLSESTITFTLLNSINNMTYNPDLFIFQISNDIGNGSIISGTESFDGTLVSKCPNSLAPVSIGRLPSSCLIGSLPMMARYTGYGVTSANPLGTTIIQLYDSIGNPTPNLAKSGTCTMTSLTISLPILNMAGVKFFLFINWYSNNTVGSIVVPSIDNSGNLTTQNNFNMANSIFSSNIITNSLDSAVQTNRVFMSRIFNIPSPTSSERATMTFGTNGVLPSDTKVDIFICQIYMN